MWEELEPRNGLPALSALINVDQQFSSKYGNHLVRTANFDRVATRRRVAYAKVRLPAAQVTQPGAFGGPAVRDMGFGLPLFWRFGVVGLLAEWAGM